MFSVCLLLAMHNSAICRSALAYDNLFLQAAAILFSQQFSRQALTRRRGQIRRLFGYSDMDMELTNNFDECNVPNQLAESGDECQLAKLFELHCERLTQMVRLRMDPRLQGRVDAADVLQEAYMECARRFAEYRKNCSMPLYVWVRFLTCQKLVDLHRHHLGTKIRDVRQEVSLYRGALPQASSVLLAAQLMGQLTSASRVAMRAETQIRVQDALNRMDPTDREVLILRHFEMLTNEETAHVLSLKKTAASNRYIRALKRLKEIVAGIPGLGEECHAGL